MKEEEFESDFHDTSFSEEETPGPEESGRVDIVKVMAIGFVILVYTVIYLKILFIS